MLIGVSSYPDRILVHGDTTTTFAATLAAYYQRIPVGHIEAGLRTGDNYSPWPEEINRKLTGAIADLHFAPTEKARENLLAENIPVHQIIVTGNTVIDALLDVTKKIANTPEISRQLSTQFSFLDPEKRLILVTGHRRENFGRGFEDICLALKKISVRKDVQIVYPVHLNPNKRVFGLVIDFGTSQSPKSTRPLTTYWCPSRPGHQALRNNFASSLLLRTWLPMTGRRVRRPTLFSLWRKARRENSAASRLLGSTSLRFALHGWQRVQEPVFRLLGEADNIHLIEPLDYLPFVYLMQQSYLVLTDSGGVQEEAPSLGKPVLVMRSTTERPEALDAGTVELVGTDTNSIVSAISDLLDQKASYEKMAFSHNPYGDGNASTRISKALSPINQPMSAVSYLNP